MVELVLRMAAEARDWNCAGQARHHSVQTSIKMGFKEMKADFDNPTRESLMKVVETLARKAASWGTPQDIIEFHGAQVMKVLQLLR